MDADQFESTLKEAEVKLRRLRALYDQWFAGIERTEPYVQRDDMVRTLARLKASPPRNTGLRFRLNQLSQQFITYQTYWKRITRQIEEGTYKRDVLRAREQRAAQRAATSQPSTEARPRSAEEREDAGGLEIDVEVAAASVPPPPGTSPAGASMPPLTTFRPPSMQPPELSPLAQPEPDASRRPKSVRPPPMTSGATQTRRRSSRPAAGAPADGVAEPQMRALYERYVSARKNNAERTDNVSYDRLAQQVNTLLPKLKAKHPGKKVGFAVVVRDGKVALKPVTK